MDEKLKNIYYQSENLWKGKKAIKELKTLSGVTPKQIKNWLSRQAFWQVHLPGPKIVNRPHYQIVIPNQMHQFDLLYMPGDKLYGTKYKYILSGIDAASRFKVARPLKTKQAEENSLMLADIYKVGPLKYPEVFQCDNGSEFKADVTKLLEKNKVQIIRATTRYKHTHTAFVESLNKILAENLFRIQDSQELNNPNKISSTWVKHLYKLIDNLNNTKTSMINMKPVDAIKLKEIKLLNKFKYLPEQKLPEDGLYRYLLQPGEEHNDQRKRATDTIWSKGDFRLKKVVLEPDNRIMYYLQDGPERVFCEGRINVNT